MKNTITLTDLLLCHVTATSFVFELTLDVNQTCPQNFRTPPIAKPLNRMMLIASFSNMEAQYKSTYL